VNTQYPSPQWTIDIFIGQIPATETQALGLLSNHSLAQPITGKLIDLE
jgi:hypothetical protein